MLYWFLSTLLCCLHDARAGVIIVPHSTFEGISIPSGLSSVLFTNLPSPSSFVLIQLHSPFNPILASVVPSFDYGASQNSEHCGLISALGINTTNVTLYLYSGYGDNVSAWVRADTFGPNFPVPGGCGKRLSEGFATAALSTETMAIPSSFADRGASRTNLRYWTSVLKFEPASLPSQLGVSICPNITPAGGLTYRLYSMPLVTAGGAHGSFMDPTPHQVAGVIKHLSSTTEDFGSPSHVFQLRPSLITKKGSVEVAISRRPGSAVLLQLVVEYISDDERTRIGYSPVVLYGCRDNPPVTNRYGSAFLVKCHSTRLSCGILPTDAPNIYFLVTVLLLASLFYGCACHLLIWPRCAASVMVVASLIGTIFFFRYSLPSPNAMLILAVSIFLPTALALAVFILIWCLCIRPTLRYQQLYGRGPLLKLAVSERADPTTTTTTTVYGPWDSDLLMGGMQHQQTASVPQLSREFFLNPLNIPSSVVEGQPIYGTFEARSPSTTDSDDQVCGLRSHRLATLRRCLFCSRGYSDGSAQLFSLKPRRIARLPPVLPASFLLVACFSVLFDHPFSLDSSSTAYLSFVILMNLLITGLLCIFKNLAFGISTAFVGVYLSLGCFCLLLLPNAVLPHILIEQFLRLTWIEQRLATVRIDFFGLYDILIIVAWTVGTVLFGLLTLCLVRLRDARELAEAQRIRHVHQPPDPRASRSPPMVPDTEVVALSHGTLSLPNRFTSSTKAAVVEGETDRDLAHNLSVQTTYGGIKNRAFNDMEPFPFTSHFHSEQSLLMSSLPHAPSYGGLADTRASPLMPLSRVQLASRSRVMVPSHSSIFHSTEVQSHAPPIPQHHTPGGAESREWN